MPFIIFSALLLHLSHNIYNIDRYLAFSIGAMKRVISIYAFIYTSSLLIEKIPVYHFVDTFAISLILCYQTETRVGLYVEMLEDWFSVFPQKQFLIQRLEDYHVNKTRVLNRFYRFLGIGRCSFCAV